MTSVDLCKDTQTLIENAAFSTATWGPSEQRGICHIISPWNANHGLSLGLMQFDNNYFFPCSSTEILIMLKYSK